jgi:hypothetical protein
MFVNDFEKIEGNALVIIRTAGHRINQTTSVFMADLALALDSEIFLGTDVVGNRDHNF